MLHLGSRRAKELDISLSNRFAMTSQRLGGIVFVGKKYKGISGRTSVGFLHEEHAIVAIEHIARRQLTRGKEIQLAEDENQSE